MRKPASALGEWCRVISAIAAGVALGGLVTKAIWYGLLGWVVP